MQIEDVLGNRPKRRMGLTSGKPDLNFNQAADMAKAKARDICADAMMLSWHSAKTGQFWPRFQCGGQSRPPWLVFAESRGANLIVDIDDGDFTFFFLV